MADSGSNKILSELLWMKSNKIHSKSKNLMENFEY